MYIDAHLHLDQYPSNQVDYLIDTWRNQGVQHVLAVSTNLQSSYQTLELRERYPEFIFAAVGYHPELLLPTEQERSEIRSLIYQEREKIAAIGEIGLPHYRFQGKEPPDLAPFLEVLAEFADLAVTNRLPLLLHAVHDKAELALSCLQQYGVKQAHFHWLKAPLAVVHGIIQAGYWVSVTPEVCYRARDQELVSHVPLSQLLMETDGPWPYEGSFKGRLTSPIFLKEVAAKVAQIHGQTPEAVLQACRDNLGRLLQHT
ncbi:TatD family hydrolase [Ammoniphilus sp. YIM 78166]|uniref:TatD family hydrolase n=1 Tax=Ammoniphilus sp. YIM 78166 TaxID=1644106 RepID=UPI0010700F96|nr:TatD family hydrolase [Ammoniphilus sp. YIM 78166]